MRQEFDFCWLGYSIHPKFARKGYIQEAVIEVSNFLKQEGYKRIKAGILTENTASKQLVKKLGFVYTDNEADEEIYVLEL